MGRRRFDHLYVELCVRAGRRLPRLELWLAAHEAGSDPDRWTRDEALAFCRSRLGPFLRERGVSLSRWSLHRLARAVERYDPSLKSPEEWMQELGG
jgi:hypothetical protein